MKSTCLSDQAIQPYAFELATCDASTLLHVANCKECKLRADYYIAISTAINEEATPEIGFDITSLVLEKVEKDEKKASLHSAIMYALLTIPVALMVSVLFLFRDIIASLLPSTEHFLMPLVLSTALTTLLLLCLDTVRAYRKKERMLDY